MDDDLTPPIPQYVGDWRVARWIGGGLTADDVKYRLPYWTVRQAQVMIAAEDQIHRSQNPNQGGTQQQGGQTLG